MTKRADVASLLLRVAAGLIFLPHGYSKVFGSGVAAFAADMPSYGVPIFLGYVAAYAEFFGSIALIAGLFTRIDAFLLACTMFVAAFVVQLPDAIHEAQPGTVKLFAILRGIELPLGMFAMTAALVILGPGRLSLDGLLGIESRVAGMFRRKTKAAAEAAARQVS
jgi:putative oxidoreductase